MLWSVLIHILICASCRDIVTLIKERNSGTNTSDVFIGSVLNPHHWLISGWVLFARIVSLYHVLMVPFRIAFQSEVHGMTATILLASVNG